MDDEPVAPSDQQLGPTTPSPPPDPVQIPTDKPSRNLKKPIIFSALIIILCGLIIGTAVYALHRTKAPSSPADTLAAIRTADLPAISCKSAEKLIRQTVDGDECYELQFKVDQESIKYVIIKQSSAYQRQQSSKCQLDCGGSIPITRSDYIVRADGKVQFALPDWTQPAQTYIDELTGCGGGVFDNLSQQAGQQKFVHTGGDIGINVTAQKLAFRDSYGDECAITFNLTQDITSNKSATAGLAIAQLRVHYDLKPAAICQNQSNIATRQQCYSDQASMRNDVSLCAMTFDPAQSGDGNESCISSLALRRQDPAFCDRIVNSGNSYVSQSVYDTDLTNCRKDSQQIKDVLTSPLVVY